MSTQSEEYLVATVAQELLNNAALPYPTSLERDRASLKLPCIVVIAKFESEEPDSALPKRYTLTVELRDVGREIEPTVLDQVFKQINDALDDPSISALSFIPPTVTSSFKFYRIEAGSAGESTQGDTVLRSRNYAVFARLLSSGQSNASVSVGGGSGGGIFGTAAYVNTGTTIGTVPVLGTGGKLPAVDGSLLTNLPSGGVVDGQQLFDALHVLAMDCAARALYDADGNPALGFDEGYVEAFGAYFKIVASGSVSAAFDLGNLTADRNFVLPDVNNGEIYVNSSGIPIKDTDAAPSVNPLSRQLIAGNGTTAMVDWSDSAGAIIIFPSSDPHVAGAGYWSGSVFTKSTG